MNCERKSMSMAVQFPANMDPKLITDAPLDEPQDILLAQDIDPYKRPECSIYRVPLELRRVNSDAYTPMLISIGPFHRKDGNLKNMENLKASYLTEASYRTQ